MISHHVVLLCSDSFASSGYKPDLGTKTVELDRHQYETLTIDDARTLIQTAFLKPLVADIKIMVIEAKRIAWEAQHALLKIFEEPPLSTKFIIVLPGCEDILPTVLSRVSMPYGQAGIVHSTNPFFTIFQASSYAARLECITRITKDKQSDQIELLRSGVLWLLAQTTLPPHASKLAYCVQMMNLPGASKKMLLDEIALLLPTDVH